MPVEQARTIAEAVKEKGGCAEVVIYEDEGHGFRLSKNIKASLEKELSFYEDALHLKSNGNKGLHESLMQNTATKCTVQ